jgi:hypothetical protein
VFYDSSPTGKKVVGVFVLRFRTPLIVENQKKQLLLP